MKGLSLRGIVTPLVTPLTSDERIDAPSLRRLVDSQIDGGVHGLWVMGTTGEFAAFDADERRLAITTVVEQAAGRLPVVANVSDAATRLVLLHARNAQQAGADAVAVTPPYYYPHSQAELLAHYRAVAGSCDLPVFIYNIPQTVRVAVGLETAITLAREGTVAGIKDSQNNLEWFRELTLALAPMRPGFMAFAGTRHLIDAAVLAGAVGAIPSLANSHARLCVDTFLAAERGDFASARKAQSEIVSIESRIHAGIGSKNAAVIGAIKAELHRRGVIDSPTVTAPLLPD